MPSAASTSIEVSVAAHGSGFSTLLESLRPEQWVKNGFVFSALAFSRNLTDWHRTVAVTAAALVFCAISSAMYLLNDVLDAPEDRRHPIKCLRTVASGRISARTATSVGTLLALLALAAAWGLDRSFLLVVVLYAVINLVYSVGLKCVALLDVFLVAAGFVLRVLGGGIVIHVELSAWLIVCTTLLALFLALSKRRHELVLFGETASDHRSALANYSPHFLDQLIAIVTASRVMSYSLYTLSRMSESSFPASAWN